MRSYGSLELTVTSPPQSFLEPLTIADAKKFLELPERATPDLEDALIAGLITSARFQAEILQKRDLVEKQYDLWLDCFPPHPSQAYQRGHAYEQNGWSQNEIELRKPLRSVALIEYRDQSNQVFDLTQGVDYMVDLARGLVKPMYNVSWPSFTPWPSSAVLVRFTSGMASDDLFWSNAGQSVLTGMRELIALWFTERLPRQVSKEGSGNWAIDQLLSAGGASSVR